MCTSFISLAWFVTAHILAYTSVDTCRFSAPHLWWLTFGILCILYVMILEIFLLGLLVFILGPVLYVRNNSRRAVRNGIDNYHSTQLAWNIILLCFGRHPLQNPHYINPDIGKLPKSIVQQIPLVLYIPPPPGESADDSTPIAIPPAAHQYPPKDSSPTTASKPPPPKRRFAFFRRKRASKNKSSLTRDAEKGDATGKPGDGAPEEDEDVPWDEMWEKSDYPFVRLEGNRAVCAICLMDFEEPRRIRGRAAAAAGKTHSQSQSLGAAGAGTQEVQVEEVTEEERDALHLNDAGEGAQPLRLLSCGHAFHVSTCPSVLFLVEVFVTDRSCFACVAANMR